MNRFHSTIILLLAATLFSTALAEPHRRKSTAGKLKPRKEQPVATVDTDTIACKPGDIAFAGYDKKLRASKETVFITNHTQADIAEIVFHIEYFDMQGRQLHLRRVSNHIDLPPGNTRCLDLPTWDKQGSFYFSGSQRPRTPAVPYTVRIAADTIVIVR